jgi:SAM-dependent methyltransferase
MSCCPGKLPKSQEGFIPTLNKMGYVTQNIDEYSQAFVEYAASACGSVLDIGAAYGNISLLALAKGAHVIANDLDLRHLEILESRVDKDSLKRLQLLPGRFPHEISFPDNSLGAILISQVLHFFINEELYQAVKKIYQWLKPNAKVFVVAGTPYIGIYRDFIPLFEQRKKERSSCPGLIENISVYKHTRVGDLPKSLNFFDDEILRDLFLNEGFIIEKVSMFTHKRLPKDIKLDGRESVGLIAIKPLS